jgi:hypothetical protein
MFYRDSKSCVRATYELSRLVIETAGQRPATLKDFRTQELALERQTRLWELRKFYWISVLTAFRLLLDFCSHCF